MKLTEENLFDVFKEKSQVVVGEGRTFVHFPFWVEATEDGLITYDFETLPESLKKSIQEMRDGGGNVSFSIKKSDIFE